MITEYFEYLNWAKVVNVVDADTYDVSIDLGYKTYIEDRVRLIKTDTWEIRGSEKELGLPAKERAEYLIRHHTDDGWIVLHSQKFIQYGSFGRILGTLYLPHPEFAWSAPLVNAINLNKLLVVEGHVSKHGYSELELEEVSSYNL